MLFLLLWRVIVLSCVYCVVLLSCLAPALSFLVFSLNIDCLLAAPCFFSQIRKQKQNQNKTKVDQLQSHFPTIFKDVSLNSCNNPELSCLMSCRVVLPHLVLSCPVIYCLVLSFLVLFCLFSSCLILSCLVSFHPVCLVGS